MYCIYHSKDLDGFTSGAIVKLKYPEAVLIGYDYGEEFPWDKIEPGKPVIMIDVSLPPDKMFELSKHTNNQLTWIDHHISAINAHNNFAANKDPFLTPVLEVGIAACEIGWKYLFPDKTMPEAVKLVGEYDTFRRSNKKRWENKILPFQYGLRTVASTVDDVFNWLLMMYSLEFEKNYDNNIELRIDAGKLILAYQDQISKVQMEKAAFECEFEGLKAICLNGSSMVFNSLSFKSVYDESKHDVMVLFQFTGDQWKFTLYTTKNDVDCSAIAKSKGGGGHKQAAGFETKDIRSIFSFL